MISGRVLKMKADIMARQLQTCVVLALTVVSCSTVLCVSGHADSLWQRRDPRRAYLFEDSRARRIGDLLTVIISQSTEVDNSENKDLQKTTGAGAKFDLATSTGGDLGTSSADMAFDASNSSNRSFSGEASYSNSRAFQDRITVRVVDIDPAGNLVIEGSRGTHISGEHRVLNISGMVRTIDIGPDNTLSSRYISDMQMIYEAAGAEPRFTQQGWLSRTMNKLWPF